MALQIVYTHAGYMATVTGRPERADWSSEGPMTADALIETLMEIGLHQQDIGDAFYEADADWLTRVASRKPSMTRNEASIARHEIAPGAGSDEVLIDLSDHGMPERFEALRVRPVGGSKFEIESVPFFVYGVARRDIVRAVAVDDVLRFDRVTRRSGHRTLHVAISEVSDLEETHEVLHALLSTSGLATEWHAAGLVAVDIPASSHEVELLPPLERMAALGVIEFEIDG